MQEKTAFQTTPRATERQPRYKSRRYQAALLLLLSVPLLLSRFGKRAPELRFQDICRQPPELFPKQRHEKIEKAYEHLASDAFRQLSASRLSGAVQIKTETFDDLGPIGVDDRWDVFFTFSAYLEKTFPLCHARLQVEKINTHGLLYTWAGSDAGLKPTLLMAHQDTVPVAPETIDDWTHPPWSGAYDGTFIWGRGARDCKDLLIALLEAVEALLEAGFEPRRTVLLAFGNDEETFGYHGAGNISAVLRDRYGSTGGLAMISDEGPDFEHAWGTLLAKTATSEKGSTNVEITVRMPGGHSSVPPDHTSIGILSELITKIEATQYPAYVDETSPYFGQLQCGAAHAPAFPDTLKALLAKRLSRRGPERKRRYPDHLALEAGKQGGPWTKYLMQTSQAVDTITGGAKVNALPEYAQVVINHRVNVGETVDTVYTRLTALAAETATKYNMTLQAFGNQEDMPRSVRLRTLFTLNPAPVTPLDSLVFAVYAGSIRAVFGEDIVVSPGMAPGNTDTRFFWDLTDHIFRFAPGYDPAVVDSAVYNLHTVDEKTSLTSHISTVRFFMLFIQNIDEAEL